NRVLLADLLKTAIAKAQRDQQWLVLFFIDLDHFKSVNDSFGHHAGDELLKLVAERLRLLVRAEDCVARLSGDEFTFLLAPENTQQQALDCADRVVKKIQAKLTESYYIEETEIFISASIGIALYPKDGESAESILKNADRSMYDVKQMGKNNYRFFSAELGYSAQRKLQLESDLRKAIYSGELELYYQPKWGFKTGELHGLEALVRWNHPQKGMLFPDEFIGVAESCGLIYQLDMWVLEAACKQLKQWESERLFSKQVSVNMSAIQFSSPDLVENIVSLLAQYEVKPDKLEIEIIESILMQDSEYTLSALAALKDLGIHIAVDDFGTGYSAMAYLNKFPIDVLKIDRAFVNEIDSSVTAKVIIESIIKMGTKLGMTIVAEGIETEEQSLFLASNGCTFAQGYFYNKPMPVDDVVELFKCCD
ncbi:MAG: bifunctional diguanylate cyclase/phosphodiesterase, partial [Thiotrichaceae bacterium]|nr:bifunctional diguanylate cyclase/phosphodiesterase [Thiotrichaceae bacterium]